MNFIFDGDYGLAPTNFHTVSLALLLSFLFGQMFAWVYMKTHAGISYSRSYVISLIVLPVLVALVLLVMSNNLVVGLGLMAVFAIVRFRNVLRDTLDTCYVLAVIIMGTACGTQKFSTAIVGGPVIAGLFLYLWMTAAGTRHRFDLILNVRWLRPQSEMEDILMLLERHCLRIHIANQHFGKGVEGADLSYRLLLRDPRRASELLSELAAVNGVDRVSSVQASDEQEI